MGIRQKFVEDFDENLALALEAAAVQHANGVNSKNQGSDPFKWVLCICIGYECFKVKEYRDSHGILRNHSFRKIKKWIVENADLASHDGDVDYLAAFSGVYQDYLPITQKEE